jgi:hypothetical protein
MLRPLGVKVSRHLGAWGVIELVRYCLQELQSHLTTGVGIAHPMIVEPEGGMVSHVRSYST